MLSRLVVLLLLVGLFCFSAITASSSSTALLLPTMIW